MPNSKISALTQISTVTGTETFPALKDGIVKKGTIANATARMRDLARYSNYSAIQDAKEVSKSSLFEGLSAGSVLQQDISGVAAGLHRSPNAVTAMFVYDASKDSDGGAWTERCGHTSWYNEPLSGKWLGAQTSEISARYSNASVGSELVSNGDFGNGTTGWSLGAGWSVSGGKAIFSGSDFSYLSQSIANYNGKFVKITFDLTISSGTFIFRPTQNSTTAQQSYTTSGTKTLYATPSSSGFEMFTTGSATGITLDNISVKEVISTSTQANDYFQLTTDGKFYALSKNLLTSTATLATQTQWLTAGTYTFSSAVSTGSVAIAFSGSTIATHAAGATSTTFTIATSGSVTFTVTGTVTSAQCELGSAATFYKANTSTLRYTEVFRGNKAEFPKLTGIVAENYNVTIYDLTEPGRPMWMRFVPTDAPSGLCFWRPTSTASSVSVLNGIMCMGFNYTNDTNNGLVFCNFTTDTLRRIIGSFTQYAGRVDGGIAKRTSSDKLISDNTYVLPSSTVNSVTMTVLPDAPIDPVTNLKIPTIAVATNGGISIIKHDSTVINSGSTQSYNSIYITSRILTASRTVDSTLYYALNPSKLSNSFTLLTENSGSTDFNQGNTAALNLKTRSEVTRSSGAKLQILKNNESAVSKGMAATITPTYNTGYMIGDIRRTYLSDIVSSTIGSSLVSPSVLFANNEVGAWYDPSDLSTLYQDSTGTIPVTGVEQSVGLMLDKSKGLVLGSELVTNGDGSSLTGWTAVGTSTWIVDTNRLKATVAGSPSMSGGQRQDISVVAGKSYKISIDVEITQIGTGRAQIIVYDGAAFTPEILNVQKNAVGSYSISGFVRPTGSTIRVYMVVAADSSTTTTAYFDNISVRELPGNHAFQSTSANRPVLSARVNGLSGTENLTVAGSTSGAATRTSNTLTVTASSADSYYQVASFYGSIASGVSVTASVEISGSGSIQLACLNGSGTDIGTQIVSLTGTPTRYSVMVSNNSTGANCGIVLRSNGVATTVTVSKLDFRITNTGTDLPAYQRVNTSTDYDTVGFPLYLKCNGTSTAMRTNSIDFSATDKMTVVMGVRKLSDAAVALIAELNSSIDTGNGAFYIAAPLSNGSTTISFASKGTIQQNATKTGLAAPITNVITAVGNISGPEATLRINGTQVATSTADQGTGNYGNYPLYLFARAGTSLFFNGQFYGLIIRGVASNATEITNAENWMTVKTLNNQIPITEFDRSYKNKTATVYGTLTKTTAI